MKATSLLESQHRKVEALFKKLKGGRSDPRIVLEELSSSLAAHMAIEQGIFYPRIKELDSDLVNESYEEHAVAELALKRLLMTDPDEEEFQARVTTLMELIEHHVEEEEKELFPEVEKTMEEEELAQLGKAMKARFEEVFEAGFAAAVPKGMAKTSSDVSKKEVARRKPAKARSAA
ncbi:MAG: hemerythrin domain-containing protein [Deltaproteobacteria bacterium]